MIYDVFLHRIISGFDRRLHTRMEAIDLNTAYIALVEKGRTS